MVGFELQFIFQGYIRNAISLHCFSVDHFAQHFLKGVKLNF